MSLEAAPGAGGPQALAAAGLRAIPRPASAASRIRPVRIASSTRGTPAALRSLAGLGVVGAMPSP
eukprot:5342168-Alexandrium_andersonii.AAC.1